MSVQNDDNFLFRITPNILGWFIILIYFYMVPFAILDIYKGFVTNNPNTTYFVNIGFICLYSLIVNSYFIYYDFYKDKIIRNGIFKTHIIYLNQINKIEVKKEYDGSYNISDINKKGVAYLYYLVHTNVDKINSYFITYLPNYKELLVYEDE